MSNFTFLLKKEEYTMFAAAAVEAEKVYASAPAMCAVGCRKALELAVKWVYAADTSIQMPYRDNLQSLIHEPSFRFSLNSKTWGKLPFIVKLGNLAVHTEKSVLASDALASLRGLFEFIQWIDYCYGKEYTERKFDENAVETVYYLAMAHLQLNERKEAQEYIDIINTKFGNTTFAQTLAAYVLQFDSTKE